MLKPAFISLSLLISSFAMAKGDAQTHDECEASLTTQNDVVQEMIDKVEEPGNSLELSEFRYLISQYQNAQRKEQENCAPSALQTLPPNHSPSTPLSRPEV